MLLTEVIKRKSAPQIISGIFRSFTPSKHSSTFKFYSFERSENYLFDGGRKQDLQAQ